MYVVIIVKEYKRRWYNSMGMMDNLNTREINIRMIIRNTRVVARVSLGIGERFFYWLEYSDDIQRYTRFIIHIDCPDDFL